MRMKSAPVRAAMHVALALIISLLVAACMPPKPGPSEARLTAEQVKQVFVGTPWHNDNGAFLFRDDGTYTYKRFDAVYPLGTWSYGLLADGTIQGNTTDYIFYKTLDGYRYFHTRTQRYYPAYPNKPPFL